MDKIKQIFSQITQLSESGGVFTKIIIALISLFIAWNVISFIAGVLNKYLNKINFDKTLQPFVLNLFTWALRAMVFIAIASYAGVETTSFVAVLGALSFAVGMALQGALANFAGGVLILMNRPYKVGDLVEMQDNIGTVKEIQIFHTILMSPENKTVILPNGAVSNGNIINYTVEGLIRVDLTVGISYDADIREAKKIMMDVMKSNPDVLENPAPFVGVSELGDSSVNLAVRPFANPEKYWDVYFSVYEDIKYALDKQGIEIPYPHQVNVNK